MTKRAFAFDVFDGTAWRGSCVLMVLLAGCGGGLYIGVGGEYGDDPPSVSLAASPSVLRAGEALSLVAAAADDQGIERVEFYQQEGNTTVLLGSDEVAPYEWRVTARPDVTVTSALSVRWLSRSVARAKKVRLPRLVRP